MKKLILPFFLCLLTTPIFGKPNPVPRFVSIRPDEVNGRVGPGPNYPVEWIYLKAGLPVEVIAEFDTWRKVRDVDGTIVWIHLSMLSSKRNALIQGAKDSEVMMYREASTQSQPLARLQKGVMVQLVKCREDWCQTRVSDFKGWIPRAHLWGVYPDEKVN